MNLRTRRIPPPESPYDGHDGYRDRYRPPSWSARGVQLLRYTLAIGVGLAFVRWTWKLLHPGQTVLLFFTTGLAVIVGFVAMVACAAWLMPRKAPDRVMTMWREGVAAALFLFGFLIPVL